MSNRVDIVLLVLLAAIGASLITVLVMSLVVGNC